MSIYIVATTIDVPNSDQKHFAVLGSYNSKEEAKTAISGFATTVVEGAYKNVSLYQLDTDKGHVYTFGKNDLQQAYDAQQEQMKRLQQQTSVQDESAAPEEQSASASASADQSNDQSPPQQQPIDQGSTPIEANAPAQQQSENDTSSQTSQPFNAPAQNPETEQPHEMYNAPARQPSDE